MRYAVYEVATGRIDVVLDVDGPDREATVALQIADRPGFATLEIEPVPGLRQGEEAELCHVVAGELVERPAITQPESLSLQADGTDEVSWPDVPAGTVVRLNRASEVTVDDADGFHFATETPGVYRIDFRPPFPWRRVRFEVTAHAP